MPESLRTILLVDGDHHTRERLAALLRKEIGCIVLEAGTPAAALALLEGQDVCLLITDLFLPKREGFELLQKVQKANPEVVTMVSVPEGDRDARVKALQLGAFFYLNSPWDFDEALIASARCLNFHDLLVHRKQRGLKMRKSEGFHGIIGQSAKMQELFELLERLAEDDSSTVLIQGESGTGKELVARALHAYSPRKGKNFVPFNCAAIPEDLLESELFGYVKGAFTGAAQAKMGRVQYADGGTLFLDEIGDMKPALQAKLLRVLQEREFEPVGGVKPVKVDVRVLAATHRDLEKMVAEGTFREDLYYRLNVVPINIPPLRERREDIPVLIEKFLRVFNRNKKHRLKGLSADAIAALVNYPWPGNVRELENLMQRLVILFGGKTVSAADLPDKYRPAESAASPPAQVPTSDLPDIQGSEGVDFNAMVNDFENRLILQALDRTRGNKKEAARLLQMKRTTLIEKLKKKGLTGVPTSLSA